MSLVAAIDVRPRHEHACSVCGRRVSVRVVSPTEGEIRPHFPSPLTQQQILAGAALTAPTCEGGGVIGPGGSWAVAPTRVQLDACEVRW